MAVKTRRIAVDVSPDEYERFAAVAQNNGRSVAGELRYIAKRHVQSSVQKEKAK